MAQTPNYIVVSDDAAPAAPASGIPVIAYRAATAALVYHGYKRTGSVAWAIGYGLLGALFPVLAVPVALAQGFGKRAGK